MSNLGFPPYIFIFHDYTVKYNPVKYTRDVEFETPLVVPVYGQEIRVAHVPRQLKLNGTVNERLCLNTLRCTRESLIDSDVHARHTFSHISRSRYITTHQK